ncbi:ketoacyl-ACP synthase III family protein [Myceligenerans cantabricum]
MQLDDVWINGLGSYVGSRAFVDAAVESGDYSSEKAASTRIRSVAVTDLAPPDMALAAAAPAIEQARAAGVTVDAASQLIHVHVGFQGLDLWPVENWLANQLLGEELSERPFRVDAASNGSLAGLETAGALLAAKPSMPSALVTVADRYGKPLDRWNLSPGMVFGDGAAAAVLSRRPGRLRLLSVSSVADTALEGLSRGDAPFTHEPRPVDTVARTREFFTSGKVSLKQIRNKSHDGVRRCVAGALADAGLDASDVTWLVPPFVGADLLRDSFLGPLDFEPAKILSDPGLTVGHLGPADQIYALDHLSGHESLHPGDHLLLIGTGMGFTFSAAVVRVENNPTEGA